MATRLSKCMTAVITVQVAHGVALHRVEALEGLAAAGAAAVGVSASGEAAQPPEQAGGVLAVAGSLKQLQVSRPLRLASSPVALRAA
jgi:hypothetical protein